MNKSKREVRMGPQETEKKLTDYVIWFSRPHGNVIFSFCNVWNIRCQKTLRSKYAVSLWDTVDIVLKWLSKYFQSFFLPFLNILEVDNSRRDYLYVHAKANIIQAWKTCKKYLTLGAKNMGKMFKMDGIFGKMCNS